MFTQDEYRCLFHGFIFYDRDRGVDTRSLWKSASLRTELAGAWQFLRPQIMREWLASEPRSGDKGGPGSRCAGWWIYDSRERRQRVDGLPHPFDTPARQTRVDELMATHAVAGGFKTLMYGCPSDYIVPDDFAARYETQAEYIDRLGLWLPGEKELYAEQQRRAAERERLKAEGKQ